MQNSERVERNDAQHIHLQGASFLGDRSIGHLDPGAQSSYLLVDAVCKVIEEGVTQ